MRTRYFWASCFSLCALVLSGRLAAQDAGTPRSQLPTKRVPPHLSGKEQDRVNSKRPEDVEFWMLDIAYKEPRMMPVNLAGKRTLVWYMLYKVTNRTKHPRRFVPDFTLITDTGKEYRDQVLPKAQRLIQLRENPLDRFKNTMEVASGEIRPTLEEGPEHAILGMAVWEGVDPGTDRFTIYVGGLSNGFRLAREEEEGTDPFTIEPPAAPGGKAVVKLKAVQRKVLELRFDRPSDTIDENEREFRQRDLIGYEWTYR